MFAKSIVLSDAFLDMPLSARCLYFTLGMLADDDGFVGNPKSIVRQCGASEDDMRVLISKKFVLSFETGVIVIKHWRMNNYLRNDRHHTTTYVEEMNFLGIDDKGAYTTNPSKMVNGIPTDNQLTTIGIPSGYQVETEVRLGKDSINNIYIVEQEEKKDTFSEDCDTIIRYLNEKTGRNYKAKTDKTRKCIHARLGEGFTVDDFKAVIDIKTKQWLKDEKMNEYLRPETLFGTKFEGYLNQIPKTVEQRKTEKPLSELTEAEWKELYNDGKVTMEDYYRYHE